MKSCDSIDKFLKEHPQVEKFEILLHDLNGVQRGKWLPRSKIKSLFEGKVKMPMSSCSLDCWGRDLEEIVIETGDADGICEPHEHTLCIVPWAKQKTGQVIISMRDESGLNDYQGDCRAVLKKIIEEYQAMALNPVIACELEFHLVEIDKDKFGRLVHTQKTLEGNTAIGGQVYGITEMQEAESLMSDIMQAAETQDLPIEALVTEFSPSQFEINLRHQSSAITACDQSSMLKRLIKAIALKHGSRATFMAKPFDDQVGNGMHMHLSIVNEKGENIFNNNTPLGSEFLKNAVAGCLNYMKEGMAIFAPNINSYRRFAPGCYAPISPSWGYENRTTALRIPAGDNESIRIEHRVAGADANPYLVASVILASALEGIKNKQKPVAPMTGEDSSSEEKLPRFWEESLNHFIKSEFIKNYLGKELQLNYYRCKKQEKFEFDTRASALEFDAYLSV